MDQSNQGKCDRKRILFVDDDPDYVESVKSLLEKQYQVAAAYSAQEAQHQLEKQKPDLILLDAMMEPKDGFTFAKELQATEQYKDIPIVMLTGMVPKIPSSRYSPADVLHFEGQDFVEKSASIDEILATVRRYLE